MECFEKLGITRLSAALYLLKKDGYEIVKKGVTKKTGGRVLYYEVFSLKGDSDV